jgi:hypothetical protein
VKIRKIPLKIGTVLGDGDESGNKTARRTRFGIIGPFLAIIYQGSGNMICIKWESYTLNMVGGHQVKLFKGLAPKSNVKI